MNLTTATPVEIDTALAALYDRSAAAEDRLAQAVDAAHHAVGDRRHWIGRQQVWNMLGAEAIDQARELADPAETYSQATGYRAHRAITAYDAAVDEMAAVEVEVAPYAAEYQRRPWLRFFSVHKGHIHNSMDCSTCNRDGKSTRFGWHPELSGLTEAEAVAKLGPSLCTVCFPTAPVEWTIGKPAPERCAGVGKPYVGNSRRIGMRIYAECSGCGDTHIVTGSGIRAHKPKKVNA